MAVERVEIEFARPYFGEDERRAVHRVMSGTWLASGKECEAFEKEFAELIGVPYALAVNSGSSANLLALAALNLPRGARVLTSGCGFPATLSPILHLGLEPVLVDYDRETYNIDLKRVEDLLPLADAVIFAHTMGSPVDMGRLEGILDRSETRPYIVEDCCEALGAKFRGRQVGSFGSSGTFSFYPSHQITALGGGGMVTFKDERHYHRAKSMRDWGKVATWDKLGHTTTTYSSEVDGVPYFPHYTYETVGYNMRLPDANAAFGRENLKRLEWVVSERKRNRDRIIGFLSKETAKLTEHRVPDCGDPSWFGVVLTLDVDRKTFGEELEKRGVRHRPFFAGNITRHKPFRKYEKSLPVADELMKKTVFVGCWAGMTEDQCSYVAESIEAALAVCRQ